MIEIFTQIRPQCNRSQFRSQSNQQMSRHILSFLCIAYFLLLHTANAFISNIPLCHNNYMQQFQHRVGVGKSLNIATSPNNNNNNDDITRIQEKAKALLQKSREKLEKRASFSSTQQQTEKDLDNTKSNSNIPFFASPQDLEHARKNIARRQQLLKSVDQVTGLVTADGEKMAALSESEEWESRSLLEVFEDENEDAYSLASQQLAQRDVAASIWNLRKTLRTEDYYRIFDKNNRFIGEDT